MGTQVSGKGWGRRRKKIITLSREWSYEKLWTLDPDVDPGDYSTPTFIVMAWMLALIDRLEAYSFCRFYFYIFVRLRYEKLATDFSRPTVLRRQVLFTTDPSLNCPFCS